jgi:hypothetical protein
MIYNFPKHITGDTWDGISSITILSQGSAINLTNCEVTVQIRSWENLASPVVFEFSTVNNNLLILLPELGVINIPAQVVDIPVGLYKYDLKVKFPSGIIKTYLKGDWEIIPSITR